MFVKGYFASKSRAGDAVGKGRWSGGRSFEKSAHLLVESPVKRAFFSTIQADLSCTLFLMRRYDCLCPSVDVFIPGVIGVAVEVISVCLEMEIDSGVFSDWRAMDFRRRPGPDEPDAQVIEDGPDHRRVFEADDDPHGALTLRTDQGIDFVG